MVASYVGIALATVVPLAALVGLVLALRAAGRAGRRDPVASWRSRAVALLCAAFVVYGAGMWVGHVLELRPMDEVCGGELRGTMIFRFVPLTNTCRLQDGSDRPLVPLGVNLGVLASLTAAGVALAASRRARLQPVRTK